MNTEFVKGITSRLDSFYEDQLADTFMDHA